MKRTRFPASRNAPVYGTRVRHRVRHRCRLQVSSAMCSILLGAYAPVDTSDGSGTNLNRLQDAVSTGRRKGHFVRAVCGLKLGFGFGLRRGEQWGGRQFGMRKNGGLEPDLILSWATCLMATWCPTRLLQRSRQPGEWPEFPSKILRRKALASPLKWPPHCQTSLCKSNHPSPVSTEEWWILAVESISFLRPC